MKYFTYFDYPGWETHRDSLIEYRKASGLENEPWTGISCADFDSTLLKIAEELKEQGLQVLQFIFITFPPTSLDNKDISDPASLYIHIDHQDDEVHLSKNIAPTTFAPQYVLNIPLINCELSKTYHYELIDPAQQERPHGWGGGCFEWSDVREVSCESLNKPAILKVSAPHAVHNPTNSPRIVASIRIGNDSPAILKLLND
jgi:hypothetical protein